MIPQKRGLLKYAISKLIFKTVYFQFTFDVPIRDTLHKVMHKLHLAYTKNCIYLHLYYIDIILATYINQSINQSIYIYI